MLLEQAKQFTKRKNVNETPGQDDITLHKNILTIYKPVVIERKEKKTICLDTVA